MSLVAAAKTSTFVRGTPVQRQVARPTARRAPRVAPARAKYGDESQYFDLDDIENTAGSWDLYGQEDDKRYPGLQAEFFNRAAGPLTRRESLLAFLGLGSVSSILLWGAKGSKDIKLPIQNGPQKGGEPGPRGKI